MRKASVSVATLAAIGASLAGVLGAAGPAAAKQKCTLVPSNKLAPHLTSPCNADDESARVDIKLRVVADGDLTNGGRVGAQVNAIVDSNQAAIVHLQQPVTGVAVIDAAPIDCQRRAGAGHIDGSLAV